MSLIHLKILIKNLDNTVCALFTDYFEEVQGNSTGNKVKGQRRRPLVQLKDDQNPSATTEEENKRQSKKYSSSFKQNQLEEIIRQRTSAEVFETTTEAKVTEGRFY